MGRRTLWTGGHRGAGGHDGQEGTMRQEGHREAGHHGQEDTPDRRAPCLGRPVLQALIATFHQEAGGRRSWWCHTWCHSCVAQLSPGSAQWHPRAMGAMAVSRLWSRSRSPRSSGSGCASAVGSAPSLGACGCWDVQAGSSGCQLASHAASSGLCLGLSPWCGPGCAATSIQQSPPAVGASEGWNGTTPDHRLGGQQGQLCCLAKNCPNMALDPHRGLWGTETHHPKSAAAESAVTCFWPSSR